MNVSVIIPFLNEGENLVKTVKYLREDYPEIEIIAINDASTDKFRYPAKIKKYDAVYHRNTKRKGVAASRDLGVSMAKNEIIVLLDGHMRIEKGWVEKLTAEIEIYSDAIYNATCLTMQDDFEIRPSNGKTAGAYFRNRGPQYNHLVSSEWVYPKKGMDGETYDIPVVLGAFYAFTKTFWTKINGLKGLKSYGSDEAFMSLKAWGVGGRCRLISSILAGHIFKKSFNYDSKFGDQSFNKMLVARCLIKDGGRTGNLLAKFDKNGHSREMFNDPEIDAVIKFCEENITEEGLRAFHEINSKFMRRTIVFENKTIVNSKLARIIRDSDLIVKVGDYKGAERKKEDFGDGMYNHFCSNDYTQAGSWVPDVADPSVPEEHRHKFVRKETFEAFVGYYHNLGGKNPKMSDAGMCLLKAIDSYREGVIKIVGFGAIEDPVERKVIKYIMKHHNVHQHGVRI